MIPFLRRSRRLYRYEFQTDKVFHEAKVSTKAELVTKKNLGMGCVVIYLGKAKGRKSRERFKLLNQ